MPELDTAELARLLGQPGQQAHFIGVGGAGMAPLAAIVAARGWRVSGCDLAESEVTRELGQAGIAVALGHDPAHVAAAELVVASSAVPGNQPELAAARRAGVPIVKRAALTGGLTRTARALCVAGTHGKTTTTALAALMLLGAGVDASVLVGGAVPGIGVGGRSGRADVLVVESDEFDRSFLNFRPYVAIVQNVEADHLDYYGDLAAIEEAFRSFLALVPPGGRAIVGSDDAGAMRVAPPDATTFGLGEQADWRAIDLRPNEVGGTDFEVVGPGPRRFSVRLAMPGQHNVRNALAAAAALDALDVDPAAGTAALADFKGPRRRFELRGEVGGVAVYDDYAHNPTKVRAALAGARTRARGRLWCVFQPHTYHRTWSLFDDFARAFGEADRVLVLPIYSPAGREEPIPEVSSERLVAAMRHQGARAVGSFDEAAEAVAAGARSGDLVLTMGAGDVTRLAPSIVDRLAAR